MIYRPCTSSKRQSLLQLGRSILSGLLVAGLVFLTPTSSLASVYGMPLSKAYSGEFFQFFEFKVVGVSITEDGFMEILFKPPKGTTTRTSVKLHVVLEKGGEIKRMQLELNRKFINDAKQGMFARDVAKSFIQAGVHSEDYESARPVVNEIFFRQKLTPIILGTDTSSSGSKNGRAPISIFKLGEGKLTSGDIIIIGEGGNIPVLPEAESELYQCFVGKVNSTRLILSKSSINLENCKIAGVDTLRITIAPKDFTSPKGSENFNFHSLPLFLP